MYLIIFLISVIFIKTVTTQNDDSILLNSAIMKNENQWSIINDDVMGGLSSSKVIINNDNIILFTGNVSLKNNGGFASLRSPVKDYNFEKFSGIETKIKGDGRRYSVSMKETTYFTGYFYTSTFETKKDEWIVVQIPFKEFKLYYFGNETNSNNEFPYNKIKEISLLIGDKQEGSFEVEIDYIKLY